MKLFIALLTLSAAAYAADIAGNWNISAPTRNGGEMKVRLVIQQSGDSYSGTVSTDEGDAIIKDVRLKDSELVFKVETDERTYEITATVAGNTMKGTYTVDRQPAGSFTATRDTSKAKPQS
jgi:hypothetical protein